MTMNPEELPVIGAVFRFGAQDRVLDSILILGPLIVVFFAVLGRSILTETVVALYVLSFVVYVPYLAVTRDPDAE